MDIWTDITIFLEKHHLSHRALVRAGATGTRAPTEIWQRVQGTRPYEGAILVNSKKSTPKLKVNHLSKINSIE